MPGGRSRFFFEHLQGKPNEQIIAFVKGGGRYVGICGGAYYASRQTVFARGTPLEIIIERSLDFYPGCAEGPIFNTEEFSYDGDTGVSETGASLVPIHFDDEPRLAYYNGGCTFHGAEATTIATYSDKRPAIVYCPVGRGDAILTGVHPEYSPQPFMERLIHHEPDCTPLVGA